LIKNSIFRFFIAYLKRGDVVFFTYMESGKKPHRSLFGNIMLLASDSGKQFLFSPNFPDDPVCHGD